MARRWVAALERLANDPRLAIATFLVAGATLVGMAWLLLHTYFGDPAIYLPFARNAAHWDPFSFNPHHFSSGSTSPIWPLILAPAWAVGAGVIGAKVIALAVTIAAGGLVVLAAHRVSGSAIAAGIACFFMIPLLGWLSPLLYETPLIVALAALSVLAGDQLVRRTAGLPTARALAPLLLVWTALPLTRPEAAMLIPLEIVALWGSGAIPGRRSLARLVLAGGAALVPAAVYFGYSQATLGVLSSSSSARALALQGFAHHLVGPFYFGTDAVDYVLQRPFAFGFLGGILGLALLARNRDRRWLGAYGLSAVTFYLAALTFVSPASYDTGRYLMAVMPLIVVGLATTVARSRRTPAFLPVLVLVGALVVIPQLHDAERSARVTRSLHFSLDEILEGQAVRHVNRLSHPGDTVLTFEVQARYLLRPDVSVLSMDGVTDGRVNAYQHAGDLTDFLRRYRPRFWISNDPVAFTSRPYLRRSVFATVDRRFAANPRLRQLTVRGITFRLVARKTGFHPRLVGLWSRLFELSYS